MYLQVIQDLSQVAYSGKSATNEPDAVVPLLKPTLGLCEEYYGCAARTELSQGDMAVVPADAASSSHPDALRDIVLINTPILP